MRSAAPGTRLRKPIEARRNLGHTRPACQRLAACPSHHCGGSKRLKSRRRCAASEHSPGIRAKRDPRDHYGAAAKRLRSLLSGVGDGQEELADQLLEEENSDFKLVLTTLSGGIVIGLAAGFCWFLKYDILGGARLSLQSAQHAALGGLAALPLAGLKAAGWRDDVQESLPLLENIHEREVVSMQPILTGMTPQQVALVFFVDVTSSVMVLLPAMQGGLQKLLQLYAGRLRDLGWPLPEDQEYYALALLCLAGLCGIGRVHEHAPSEEEFEVVGEAVSNADRYYQLVNMSTTQRREDADQASRAFKITAAMWFEQKTYSSMFSAAQVGVEVVLLGYLWHWTHDLATAWTAALLIYGVDFLGVFWRLQRPAMRER